MKVSFPSGSISSNRNRSATASPMHRPSAIPPQVRGCFEEGLGISRPSMGAEEEISDIVIVGGGLTGLTAALALGAPAVRTPFKVILANPLDPVATLPDARALAITYSSQLMFEAMGLWGRIAPHAEPLREIIVTDSMPGVAAHPILLRMEEKAPRSQ